MKIVNKVLSIGEGWKNYYFKKATIEQVAEIRRNICKKSNCGYYTPSFCNECGCPFEKKIRSLRTGCGLGHWGTIKDLKLQITDNLFIWSGFYVSGREGSKILYKHAKRKDVVYKFDPEKQCASNGISIFETWNEVQDHYYIKTGKRLN